MKLQKTILGLSLLALLNVGCESTRTAIGNAAKEVVKNTVDNASILVKLNAIPQVKSVKTYPLTDHFTQVYEVWFEQPLDYNDLSKGTFPQRVLVQYVDAKKPVIVELQGYQIYGNKAGELAKHFLANQVTVEHRFFAKSRPETISWDDLTLVNAAEDQHRIIQSIKKALFSESKFLSTGISKGGQTTMYHRSKYPKDVDASVCYVAPLCFEREDPRIYTHLENVSTAEDRMRIKEFQVECLKRKSKLLPMLKEMAKAKKWSWEFGSEKALEYSVLEYPFSFWQWGGATIKDIPLASASDQELLSHLLDISGVSFFEEKGVDKLQPYFYTALTEMGIYGYKTEGFKPYLSSKDELYKFDWAFPTGVVKEYNPTPMKNVKHFIDTDAKNMMFVYGEFDTWTATAVELESGAEKRAVYKFVNPKGSHATRINSFEINTRNKMFDIISNWVK